jgi:signal transduction histidine kinase/DNA-binding response OmpR family regulator/streptogramin lyase
MTIFVESATANRGWKWISTLYLWSMVALLISACNAQAAPAYVHESWSVRDGLPVNTVNQIIQSKQGYLWLATFDGLVRFDGARFHVYNISNTVGLRHQRLVSIVETEDGRLLLTSDAGVLQLFDPNTAAAEVLWASPNGRAPVIRLAPNGEIWISLNPGLGRLRGNRIEAIAEAPVAQWQVSALDIDANGKFFVGTRNAGVWQWDTQMGQTPQTARQLATPAQLTVDRIYSIAEDGDGVVWVAGERGIQLIDARGAHALRDNNKEWRVTTQHVWRERDGSMLVGSELGPYRFKNGRMTALDATDARRIPLQNQVLATDADWLVTASGVFRRSATEAGATEAGAIAAEATVTSKTNALYRLDDLQATRFTHAFRDRGGSLWLATSGAGLHRLRPATFSALAKAEGLSAREVYPLHQSADGAIWIGTQKGGLNRTLNGRVQIFGAADGLEDENIRAIASDSDGALWVATEEARLYQRQPNGKFQAEAQAAIANVQVKALFLDRDGTLWAGAENGLYRRAMVNKLGVWQRHAASDALSGCTVRVIRQSDDGAIWLGSHRCGVAKLKDGQLQRFNTDDDKIGSHVRDILFIDARTVLIATEDRGVGRINLDSVGQPQTAQRVSVRAANGLLSDGIHQLLRDGYGWLWMSTNRGIFRTRQSELLAVADQIAQGKTPPLLAIDSYAEAAGLRNREANGGVHSTALVTKSGQLWFATQDGVAIVDPNPKQLARPLQLMVERVSSGERRWLADQPLSLPADARTLRIDYTELLQMDAAQTRFRYQLQGYDDHWIEAGSERSANYTKLPPGDYTFRVEAWSGAAWSADGASLQLSLKPYFTETLLFRALLAAMALGLVWLTYRARVGWLNAQRRELQHQVNVRTEQLALGKAAAEDAAILIAAQADQLREVDKQKSRFFDDLAHELRTPLTLILGPLRDVQRGTTATPEPAIDGAIRNSEVLLDLTNQLLDLARLEAGKLRLDRRREDLVVLLRASAERFQATAVSRGIGFRYVAPAAPVWAEVDIRHAGKIIDNLLSNAFKFSLAGAKVELSLSLDNAKLARIEVADTGVGIAPEHLAHVFERFYQTEDAGSRLQPGTGIGLALVHDLTELHDGRLDVQSTPGVGTTFTVLMPLCEPAAITSVINEELAGASAVIAAVEADDNNAIDNESDIDADSDADRTTILVVDDHPELRAHVRDRLSPKYRVLEAADGLEALALVRERMPDLVVADISMPKLDGYGLCVEIRRDPELDWMPVILLTARAGLDDRLEGLRAAADDYLTKPFDSQELLARIDNLIGLRRRLRDRLRDVSLGSSGDNALDNSLDNFSEQNVQPQEVKSNAAARASIPIAPGDNAVYRERLMTLIRARMSDETFKVADLAIAMDQDRSHLYRRVHEVTGQAPSDVIRELRLQRAAELLHANAGPIGEIAYAVGFSSVAYFTKCFRERYGRTPTQSRGVRVTAVLETL